MLTTRRTMTRRCKSCRTHAFVLVCPVTLWYCKYGVVGVSNLAVDQPPLVCCSSQDNNEFYTEWEETFDSFDQMGLHENLLRGIYAYGKQQPVPVFSVKGSYCFNLLQVLRSLLPFSRRALSPSERDSMSSSKHSLAQERQQLSVLAFCKTLTTTKSNAKHLYWHPPES